MPLGSTTAAAYSRATFMFAAACQVPVDGVYRSAPVTPPQQPSSEPPATRTCPLGSRLAVAQTCPVAVDPVSVQVAVAGL